MIYVLSPLPFLARHNFYIVNLSVFHNFSAFARRVVAVELNKMLCIAANENLAANDIKNVLIIPCDSEIFAKRILKNKSYIKEDTGETYNFKIVLVDPPRYGFVDFDSIDIIILHTVVECSSYFPLYRFVVFTLVMSCLIMS